MTTDRIFATLASALLIWTGASAQDIIPVLEGNIRDLSGVPVTRVKIKAKQTGGQTKTDKIGNFSFKNVPAGDTLLVYYDDEVTPVPVAGRPKIAIKIACDLTELINPGKKKEKEEEMVDTGYGKIKKSEYSGSSTSLNKEDIQKAGFKTLVEAVMSMGFHVTSEGQVKIRGSSSFNLSTDALLLCDDTEIGSLFDIDINDVQHIEVLKQGDMYGVRGANGVVVIRTGTN